jgi:molecular chaperone GrpE (heat shock protein)
MNEADTSNNRAVMESLNSANLPQLEQASCPFYSVVPNESMAITKLPLLKPAQDTHYETEVLQSEDTPQQDWVAEPESEKQAVVDSEFQQLLALNEELRAANSDLYKQVEQLKDDLAESQKVLQWQKTRSSVSESMLNQHTQELAAAQGQIKSLFQQLETATQTVQHQEIFIETYKAQLQISQQRLAQLERECSLLQTNYSDQSQQLLQSETTCRELRTRLMRQQRQTLQFKAALEKCLDTSVPSYDSLDDTAKHPKDITSGQTRFSRKARSLFPNVQPIKPWSAEPESLTNNLDNLWGESSAPPSYQVNQPTPTSPSSPWNWSIKEETPTPAQPDPSPAFENPPNTPEPEVSPSESSNLDQQLDSLIQMFFTSQPPSVSSPVPTTKTNLDNNPANDQIWNTLATILEDEEELETPPKQQFEEPVEEEINHPATISPSRTVDSPISTTNDDVPISPTSPHIETTAEETDDYWSEISRLTQVDFSASDLSQESSGDNTNETNSPSPVVYPQRPPKGRKSLASVELPNFRPNNQ